MLIDVITKGTTNYSTRIKIIDSTDGSPEQAVEHNTSGISLWYRRQGAAKVAITPAALSALTDAHTDGGIEHIDDGDYRLDLPDAAVADGADYVDVGGTVTGMIVIGGRIQLDGSVSRGISGWTGYVPLTTNITNLSEVPRELYIDLSLIDSGNAWWTNVQSDGSDIRVTDGNGNTLEIALYEFNKAGYSGYLIADCYTNSSISTSALKTVYIHAGNASTSFPSYNIWDVTGGPIAAYEFHQDPTAGSPQLTDQTGGGYNGTVNGTIATATGKLGSGWNIADDAYITLSSNPLSASSYYSVEMWVKPTEPDDPTSFLFLIPDSASWADPYGVLGLRYVQTTHKFETWINGYYAGANVSTTSGYSPGSWYHVAVTFNGSTLKIYVNGTEDASTSYAGTLTTSSYAPWISAQNSGGEGSEKVIDSMRIYNRAMSANEIATRYANGNAATGIWQAAGNFYTNPTGGSGGASGGFPLIGSGGLVL